MEGGMNWEDEWEQKEGLVVRELGMRVVTEMWSMGGGAWVKEWKLTMIESTTTAWCSKNKVAQEHSQIKPISSYLDTAKFNLDTNTKVARVPALYKYVAQRVKPSSVSDGSMPDAGLDWRGTAIAQVLSVPGTWDKQFIPKFSLGARDGRLTPETL
jgi:hypothetical protein